MDSIIYNFTKKKYLKAKHPTLTIKSNHYREYIYIDDLNLLSRFTGEVKNKIGGLGKGYQIFLRGQTDDHKGMIPSIFRENKNNNISKRYNAYLSLLNYLHKQSNLKRFSGEIGGAVLQHYGIKTPWLDLIDNLFLAIWFASMQRTKTEPYDFEISKKELGFIYYVKVEKPNTHQRGKIIEGNYTRWCDLRRSLNSLSLRPHNQHGIFFTKKNINKDNSDLNEFVVATVGFPINKLKENIINLNNAFPTSFMFPSSFYDNTYKVLKARDFNRVLEKIEKECGLYPGEIGKINLYN